MTALRLTDQERRLLQDTTLFPMKAAMAVKIACWLTELRDLMKVELEEARLLMPAGTDLQQGQLVRGEHLLDFPYHYLDFPKFFKPGEMCTYRALVWWGHGVVFALMLQGRHQAHYTANLLAAYDHLADRELAVLMTETPWEWRRDEHYLLPLRRDNRAVVEGALVRRPFLKLHRCLPFDHPAIIEGRLADEGLATFKLMAIILAP
ncbi:MAG TPA: hypothetical protein VLY45_02715 [Nitrospiria bacterium]|nr:hypothetical protein [Nitrospiria bacterium]